MTHTERPSQPRFTCPECGTTSYNPNDIRDGYCGNCHAWTVPGTTTLQCRSPMEKAAYLLACLTLGTTSAAAYDVGQAIFAIEAILDAAGLTAAPVGAVKYKPCCTWCAARFEIHTDRAAAIAEATAHIEHARGHVVELRTVIACEDKV